MSKTTPVHVLVPSVSRPVLARGREALSEALAQVEVMLGGRCRDSHRAELWGALVSGQWSLLDHFEHRGRRYFMGRRNSPRTAQRCALTERESQVWAHAALGQSNKVIADALGCR